MPRPISLFGMPALAITRFRVGILLVFLLFASSSIGFAVWDETSPISDSQRIVIGEGTTFEVIRVTKSPDDAKRLVPLGAFIGHTDTDYYEYTYSVFFNKTGRFELSHANVTIGGGNSHAELIQFSYAFMDADFVPDNLSVVLGVDHPSFDVEENGFRFDVTVRVHLGLPEDRETYEAIVSQALEFDLFFRMHEI